MLGALDEAAARQDAAPAAQRLLPFRVTRSSPHSVAGISARVSESKAHPRACGDHATDLASHVGEDRGREGESAAPMRTRRSRFHAVTTTASSQAEPRLRLHAPCNGPRLTTDGQLCSQTNCSVTYLAAQIERIPSSASQLAARGGSRASLWGGQGAGCAGAEPGGALGGGLGDVDRDEVAALRAPIFSVRAALPAARRWVRCPDARPHHRVLRHRNHPRPRLRAQPRAISAPAPTYST